MPTSFIMPKFDMDQETATISEWLKSEGDPVKIDEPVLIVETDKVSIEVPSPVSGTLAGINADVGDVVPVTTVIAHILAEGETLADLPEHVESLPVQNPIAGDPQSDGQESLETPISKARSATPVASRMAEELGLDLSQVPASGTRVTKEDIDRFVNAAPAEDTRVKVRATPAARRIAREEGIELDQVVGSGPQGRVQEQDVIAVSEKIPSSVEEPHEREAEVVPLVGIRQTIADRMQASFQTAPHIALTVDVDVTDLEAARTRMNELAARKGEAKVSLTVLLVRIVAWALERHPYINASLIEDGIHLWKDINVSVATALPEGLIVPVIHQTNRKSVREINQELRDLADRARKGQLALHEVQNGTFTITNLGMFGIKQFRAIINPPESAILAVGSVVRQPVVINDLDEVAVRPIMTLTLSADHRVVDGAVAANFLVDLVEALKTPDLLLY